MFNKLLISGLTVLTLFIFGSVTNSQFMNGAHGYYVNVYMSPDQRAYAPDHVWNMRTNGFTTASYYAYLPGSGGDPYYKYQHVSDMYVESSAPERAQAVTASTQYIRVRNGNGDIDYVFYRKYVRPGDLERIKAKVNAEEETYLASLDDPVVNSRTSTGVPPHGYKYYVEKPAKYLPIRDFRASMWLTKEYDDSKSHPLYQSAYLYRTTYNEQF